jgi:hypothetical protein
MLRRVPLVINDVSEELIASIIRMALVFLMMEALSSTKTPVLTRTARRNIPEDAILHIYRRENLKSYQRQFLTCRCNTEPRNMRPQAALGLLMSVIPHLYTGITNNSNAVAV